MNKDEIQISVDLQKKIELAPYTFGSVGIGIKGLGVPQNTTEEELEAVISSINISMTNILKKELSNYASE